MAHVSRPTSFYYAFLVLPKPQREAIIALWDFCRAVDDAVDEPPPGGESPAAVRRSLEEWRQELERCYAGTPETPQGRALQPWIRRFALSRAPLADLIDGCEMDVVRSRYQTFDELHEYCWRVAATVGLACMEIFGQRGEPAREYAMNLGVALQLTNIVRDVAADAARDRVYLPQEDLRQFGCTDGDLGAGRLTPQVRALLAFESGRARCYYDAAARVLPRLDPKPLVAAEIMARIYRETLDRIEAGGYDVFSRRVRVPRGRRVVIAADTWFRTRLGRHVPA